MNFAGRRGIGAPRLPDLLESVRSLQAGLYSFLCRSLIKAKSRKRRAFQLKHSKPLVSSAAIEPGDGVFDDPALQQALLDHTLTLLNHAPMETMAKETIAAMIRSKAEGPDFSPYQRNLPFELNTQENI